MVELPNSNRTLADSYIRHQVYLLRYSKQLSKDLWDLLAKKDEELAAIIQKKEFTPGMLETAKGREKALVLQNEISNLREAVWGKSNDLLNQQMIELVKAEPLFIKEATVSAAPVVLNPILPGAVILKSIVTSRPFEGRLLSEWADKMEADDIARIHNQIQLGLASNETNYQITKRILGTAKLANSDGIVNATKNQISAIVRTAVMHVVNNARFETMLLNKDLFSEEEYDATLDSRTTKLCASLDKKRFPVGKGPYPPLHIRCRSVRRPYFSEVAIGQRPSKPVTEKMLLRRYAEENKLTGIKSRDDLPHGSKGDFDKFARLKTREMIGPVSGDESFGVFLKRQPIEFQEEWMGKTKAKLFRDGGLKIEDFVHQNGDEMTLAEIARNNAAVFKKAGLVAEDFIN